MYLLVFLLHGLAYNNPSLQLLTFGFSAIFFFLKYKSMKRKIGLMSTRFVMLMAYSLPFSWRSIIAGDYGALPLSWFYLFGLFFIVSLLIVKKKWEIPKNMINIFVTSLFVLIFSLIPILNSNPDYRSQAISQFIVIMFNFVMIIASLFRVNSMNKDDIHTFKRIFVLGGYYTGLMLVLQFILFKLGNFEFAKIDFLYNRELFYYLFTDVSHGTLYLALTVFCAFDMFKQLKRFEKLKYIFFITVSLAGAALTSARTGLVILFAFLFIYILFKQRGIAKKILSILGFAVLLYISLTLFLMVRPQTDLSSALSGSGRIEGYLSALGFLFKKPLLGYGFSRDYISNLLGYDIPHLSILQYSIHGGIFYALIMYYNQFLIFLYSAKHKSTFAWLIAIVIVGTCLIPDMFATRFLTIIVMVALMETSSNEVSFFAKKPLLKRVRDNLFTTEVYCCSTLSVMP
ncbi:hypothetical protein ABE872_09800 [Enterococcus gallinarum]|uniref:hypothetical protein n=1 Tax=Enterococcus gallinarum TaxID=1353 RepID=UPI003D6B2CFC